MRLELPRRGYEVTVCPDGLTAVASLEKNSYDCIIVDLDMPGLNGLEVVQKAKEISPTTEAVIQTGKSTMESAIGALRQGAFEYLTKPWKMREIQAILDRISVKRQMANNLRAVKMRLEQKEGAAQLIGTGQAMEQIRRLISRVAPKDSTVLIRGETGTGKELVARSVHDQSNRVDAPFVTVNCGALPENLIESELFGHRKGAYTGANEHRTGLFEVADGGTLFLDEIGELPKAMQAKLLRVLESGEVRRVGENTPFTVDVRIVCATHRDLESMVAEEAFRQDLMFRINPFEILLPPLRERAEDIQPLAAHLLQRFWPGTLDQKLIADDAMQLLMQHTWPGNVRELANVMEHATILCDQPPILTTHLPQLNRGTDLKLGDGPIALRDVERMAIQHALDRHDGNKPKAAEELGVSLKTLYNKLSQAKELRRSA